MTYNVSMGTLNPTIPYHTIMKHRCLLGYHAPLDVFGELQQRVQDHAELLSYSKPINVCIGKEWHRFPSNFFLPNDR